MVPGRRIILAVAVFLASLLPSPARCELVDGSATMGSSLSLVLDSQRQPRIAYYDATSRDLKYASRSGGVWTIEVVDTTGNVGSYCSLALTSADVPRIAYYDASNGNLKYASKSGSTWSREVAVSINDVGSYCSLVLDSGNTPHISYRDATNTDLKYVYKSGAFWLTDTVDNAGGSFTSIQLDSNEVPCIAYIVGGALKYATGGAGWTIETAATGPVPESALKDVSLALDDGDDPHIAFTSLYSFGGDVHSNARYATRSGITWSNVLIYSGDTASDLQSTSIALDSDDEPHLVCRYDGTSGMQIVRQIRHAWHAGGSWSGETFLTLGTFGSGLGMSLAIDPQDELSLAYISASVLHHAGDPRTIDVTSPPSGQQYGVSEVVDVGWTTTLSPTADVRIEYGLPGGSRQTIGTVDAGSSPFPWLVPEDNGSGLRIWVSDAFDGTPIDSVFSLSICPALSTVRQFIDYSAPNDILSADFNEDRIPDMVVCLSGVGGIGFDVALGTGSPSGVGDGDFESPDHYAVSGGSSVRDAAAGDFNADGRLDLALSISAGVQIFLGNGTGDEGDGTFTAGSVAAGGSATRGIVAADFDEDGLLDVALVNGGGNTISVFRGLGNGTLQAGVTYAVGSSPSRMFVGDFNEDGIWDLAVTNNIGDTISILRGQGSGGKGSGTFLGASHFSAGDAPLGLAGGDFNDDGITDLVVAGGSTVGVSLLIGNGAGGVGNGTFAAPISYPFGSTARDVGVADMNGDGIADILASAGSGDGVAVFFGSGTGGLGDGGFVYGKTVPGDDFPNQMVVGDFVEDGRPDCLTTFGNTNSILLYESVCTSIASTSLTTTVPNGGEYWLIGSNQTITWSRGSGVMAVDLEVSRDSGSNWDRIATNLTGTSFSWTVTGPVTADARVRVVDSAVSSRLDGSNLDFAIAAGPYLLVGPNGGESLRSFDTRNVTWLTNTTGTVTLEYRIGNGPKQTIAASTANDGTHPWFVPNTGTVQARVFLSNGATVDSSDAYFSICQRVSEGVLYPSAGAGSGLVATGDFNDDGITDLVQAGCALRIHPGLGSGGVGNGAFGPATSIALQNCGGAVVTGDFNDDRITDLAATDGSGLSTFRGQGSGGIGTGAFVRSATYACPSITEGLAIADFNEDGVDDLVTALPALDQVAVFLGNGGFGIGTGTFSSPTLVAVGDGPMDVVVQDFNEDGIWDVVSSNGGSANLSFLRGDGSGGIGNGSFVAAVTYAGPGGSRLQAADFTGDANVDLAGGNVTVVPGTGSSFGTFGPAITTPGLYPVLMLTDLDNEGDPDLIGLGSGTLELMRHNTGGNFLHAGTLASMGTNPGVVAVGDFLEDGVLDIAAISQAASTLAVSLGSGCDVSPMVLSITEPSPTTWAVGTARTFNWSRSAGVHRVDVEISRDNGVNWEPIARQIDATSFIWTVTGPPTTQARLRVRDTARATVFDMADAVATITGSVSDVPPTPETPAKLLRVSPNPASGPVTLELSLPEPATVEIDVYDVRGRLVRTLSRQTLPAGTHAITWDGSRDDGHVVTSGIYWARARWAEHRVEQRIVRIR